VDAAAAAADRAAPVDAAAAASPPALGRADFAGAPLSVARVAFIFKTPLGS
jgi:hypothetical protein